MLMYWKYLSQRYLGQKGQGIVEYAVILAVVVGIGVALSGTGSTDFAGSVKGLYTSLTDKVKTLIPAAKS